MLWRVITGALLGLLALWLVLVVVLHRAAPDKARLQDTVRRHWPGTEEGLATVLQLTGPLGR